MSTTPLYLFWILDLMNLDIKPNPTKKSKIDTSFQPRFMPKCQIMSQNVVENPFFYFFVGFGWISSHLSKPIQNPKEVAFIILMSLILI
jgi:hypothetical protein